MNREKTKKGSYPAFYKISNFKDDGLVKSPNFDGFGKCSRSRLANPEGWGVVILRRSDPATAGQAQDAA